MQELLLGKDAPNPSTCCGTWRSLLTLLPFSFVIEGPAIIVERLSYVSRTEPSPPRSSPTARGVHGEPVPVPGDGERRSASMQVLGNLKNVFTSTVSVFVFRNAVTSLSIVGYGITMAERGGTTKRRTGRRRRRAKKTPRRRWTRRRSGQANARERPCERLRLIYSHALLLQQ